MLNIELGDLKTTNAILNIASSVSHIIEMASGQFSFRYPMRDETKYFGSIDRSILK